jgi:hypothetical protein
MGPPTNINVLVCIPFSTGQYPFDIFLLYNSSKGYRPVEKGMQTKMLMFVGGPIT